MTDNVITIHGNTLPGQPVPDVIDTLREMLARAERGEIHAVAIVTVDTVHDVTGTSWSGGAGTRHALASGIAMLAQRYTEGMLRGRE